MLVLQFLGYMVRKGEGVRIYVLVFVGKFLREDGAEGWVFREGKIIPHAVGSDHVLLKPAGGISTTFQNVGIIGIDV